VLEASFSGLNRGSWFYVVADKSYALLRFHLNVLVVDVAVFLLM